MPDRAIRCQKKRNVVTGKYRPPSSQLRSSDIATFVVPRTNTRLGDRAFPVAGPRLWNSLPSNLRQSDLTLQQFRRALKDVSVWLTGTPAPSDIRFYCAIQMLLLTYLLIKWRIYLRFRNCPSL